jgi:hypothetical protein
MLAKSLSSPICVSKSDHGRRLSRLRRTHSRAQRERPIVQRLLAKGIELRVADGARVVPACAGVTCGGEMKEVQGDGVGEVGVLI